MPKKPPVRKKKQTVTEQQKDLAQAVLMLDTAYQSIKHFAAGRDKDLCFLPQKVYNAWFDLDATLRKLRKQPPVVKLDPWKEPS